MKNLVRMLPLLLLAACATVNIPGNSVANPTLKSDIARMINLIENAQASGCHHQFIEAKYVGQEGNVYFEEWKVLSCGKEIIYPVKLTPSPQGGTDFSIKTPEKAARGN